METDLPPPEKPKVLLVDDEANILYALKRVLHRDGYDIDLAEGGAEGIRKLEEREYAVIICDQRMPDVSGADVLARSCKVRPDTYRITLTGYTDLESAQRSINEGNIHRFLTKPWDEGVLREIVRQGVASHTMIQDNRRLSALAEERRIELERWNEELEAKIAERTRAIEVRNKALLALRDRAEASLRDTVLLLVSLLDAADADAAAHSRRVAELSVQIGKKLEVDERDLQALEFSALLHEIGRLADLHEHSRGRSSNQAKSNRIPMSEVAHAMLGQVHGFEGIAEAIRCVPAPYGGGGKFSEKESSIPLHSRIIATADVYDRAAVDGKKCTEPNLEAGRKAVRAAAKSKLDPKIVQILDSDEEEAPALAVHEIELSPTRLRPGMFLARDLASTLSTLLLAAGTELDEALIKRIRQLASEQMLSRGVFVRCDDPIPAPADDTEDALSIDPQRDVA